MEQLKIEILDATVNMAPSGSNVLRSLQNDCTPKLDLLVRESIQNSLDAHNGRDKYVTVKYQTGEFESVKLNERLEVISDKLNNKFPKGKYPFLCIQDMGTCGLTGPVSKELVSDNKFGNLIKLVYDVSKPQEVEGAGGSWGIGKTIYFRLGVGLVFYYSSIYNEEKDLYESRLAACMVEDESMPDAMLPPCKEGISKSGIAWWGYKQRRQTKTTPITTKTVIKEFLDIFGITPFGPKTTGTMIFIPYLRDNLITDNIRLDAQDKPLKTNWHSSVEEFIKMSVQRWYCPRLSNTSYPYGCYLRAYVNDEEISKREMAPVFRLMQTLYNTANEPSKKFDYKLTIDSKRAKIETEQIRLNKVFASDTQAGTLSWAIVTKEELGICSPFNNYEPYLYFDLDQYEGDTNRPVLAFSRKPGMVVSYVQDGDWLSGLPSTDKDKYVIAYFSLRSNNILRNGDYLEKYVRGSERADHRSWEDHTSNGDNGRIISAIKKNVAKKLSERFITSKEEPIKRISGLGQLLSKLVLPPEGFGIRPVSGKKIASKNATITKKKGFSYKQEVNETIYSHDSITFVYALKLNSLCPGVDAELKVSTETGDIILNTWEQSMNMPLPFYISEAKILLCKINKDTINTQYKVSNNKELSNDKNLALILQTNKNSIGYKVNIQNKLEQILDLKLFITLALKSREIKPQIFISEHDK